MKALLLTERHVSSPEGLRHEPGPMFLSALELSLSRSFRLHDGPFKPNSVLLFKPKLRAFSFAKTLPCPPSMKSADVKELVQPDDIRLDRPEHATGGRFDDVERFRFQFGSSRTRSSRWITNPSNPFLTDSIRAANSSLTFG